MKEEKTRTEMPEKYKDKAEQVRFENYEARREKLLQQGYKEHFGVISVAKANILAFVTAGPFAVLAICAYMMVWKQEYFEMTFSSLIMYFGLVIISIPVHEGIHGITWAFFCKEKWKSIYIGFIVEKLTPFCHCKEPLKFGQYILGGLMPFFILGAGVSIAGIASHSMLITLVGVTNILCAGGDTTISLMLLKYRDALLLDHPKECGFIAFTK